VRTTPLNTVENGLAERIIALRSDLLAALPSRPSLDVIISASPPFAGEPRDGLTSPALRRGAPRY
jgi:hypothetical protein